MVKKSIHHKGHERHTESINLKLEVPLEASGSGAIAYLLQVEPVGVHDLYPGIDKILNKLFLVVVLCIEL